MKKILLTAAIVVAMGCGKKDKSTCYQCTIKYYNASGVTDPGQDDDSNACYNNTDELKAHESANTKANPDGTSQKMTCLAQ